MKLHIITLPIITSPSSTTGRLVTAFTVNRMVQLVGVLNGEVESSNPKLPTDVIAAVPKLLLFKPIMLRFNLNLKERKKIIWEINCTTKAGKYWVDWVDFLCCYPPFSLFITLALSLTYREISSTDIFSTPSMFSIVKSLPDSMSTKQPIFTLSLGQN